MDGFKLNTSVTPLDAPVNSDFPLFQQKLVDAIDLPQFKKAQREKFSNVEQELLGMKIQLKDTPSTDSLVTLYSAQVKGRGYFERASQVYREYMKYYSTVKLLKGKANQVYNREYEKATEYIKRAFSIDYKSCKGFEERSAMITAIIPTPLKEELFLWECLETEAQTSYNIIKSYVDEFKSLRDEILVQLSIIKNLIALGGLSIDPEAVRALQVIEGSYRPTQRDVAEKEADYAPTVDMSEGVIQL